MIKRALHAQGRRVLVREQGHGPALLLLHGLPTSGLLYRDCFEPLSQAGYRVIAPDLPGYGESDGIEPTLSVRAHVDWAQEVLDQLGVERTHVAGLDMGGLIAAGLCLQGRARHLALTSTAIGPGWLPAKLTALPGPHLLFYELYGGRLWLQQGVHPDRVQALQSLHSPRLESDPGFVARMQGTALAFSWREWATWPQALKKTPNPKRLIWGDQDRFFAPWVAKRIAANLGCGIDWIQEGRHHLPFGRPQAYCQALLAFLQSERPPPGTIPGGGRRASPNSGDLSPGPTGTESLPTPGNSSAGFPRPLSRGPEASG